jgi:uncharacterized cupin superfamily protein
MVNCTEGSLAHRLYRYDEPELDSIAMTDTTGIVRLERDGPSGVGLAKLELDPKDFQSDLPDQHIHVYYEDPALGMTVGVWTTTDMQEAFGPYPDNEFMFVLEGRVVMIDGDGNETPVEEGESFFVRKAIPISWKQEGFLRKFFITYSDPGAPVPRIDSADGGVIVFNPQSLEAGLVPQKESIGGGTQRDNLVFTNDTANMTVGMWETTAFKREMQPFSVHEFAQIVEGDVTIVGDDGARHRFTAGDVVFVPKGTVCSWQSDNPLEKFYAIVDPSPDRPTAS